MKTVSPSESSTRYDKWHREVAAGEESSEPLLRSWHLSVLSLLPVPFLSTVLQASALSLKFILAGELRATIRERTFAE